MPMRLIGTRSRSCAPCTTKRPAATGARPSRLARTQSCAASGSKVQRVRGRRAGGERHQRPHRGLVGRLAKMHGERPAAVRLLDGRRRHLGGVEALGERIADGLRRGSLGGEPRDHAGGAGAEAAQALLKSFCSSPTFTATCPQRRRPIHRAINTLSSVYRQMCPPAYPAAFQCLLRTPSTASGPPFAQGCPHRRGLAAPLRRR